MVLQPRQCGTRQSGSIMLPHCIPALTRLAEHLLSLVPGIDAGYGVLGPFARRKGWAPGPIGDWKDGATGWILWVSLAIMLGDSMTSLALLGATSLQRQLHRRRYAISQFKQTSTRRPHELMDVNHVGANCKDLASGMCRSHCSVPPDALAVSSLRLFAPLMAALCQLHQFARVLGRYQTAYVRCQCDLTRQQCKPHAVSRLVVAQRTPGFSTSLPLLDNMCEQPAHAVTY